MNPNNCAACDHKAHPDGEWCYMFRHEPKEACAQHTMRRPSLGQLIRVFGNWPASVAEVSGKVDAAKRGA